PNSESFFDDPHKRITLMGMSNIGKTRLASHLPKTNWYHYSVDYRLATAYLREDIIDVLKMEMMKTRLLATCLRQDAVRIDLNVTFSNLAIVSQYLGMLGARRYGGLPRDEFEHRQQRHRNAEIAALRDLEGFIGKARQIYGYAHFINDASGSLCELIDPTDDEDPVLRSVTNNSLLVYIMADVDHETRLVEEAKKFPKPLYYRPEFLSKAVDDYLSESGMTSAEDIDPNLFVRWVFPRLLEARRPRYEEISKHGCVITRQEAAGVRNENDFVRLIGKSIDRRNSEDGAARDRLPDAFPRSALLR
ncbi:MAG: ATPase, partial [Rhizobiales bacterium]|nr:ATPase [Hyphomicrobiales bacterium]